MRGLAILLIISVMLTNCAEPYGEWDGPRAMLHFDVDCKSQKFAIATISDFLKFYPDEPSIVSIDDKNLSEFLYESAIFSSDSTFPIRPGAYIIAYQCGNFEKFSKKYILQTTETQQVDLGCGSQ